MFHGGDRIGLLKFDDLDDGSPAVDLLRTDWERGETTPVVWDDD